jgi:hypothetical protein
MVHNLLLGRTTGKPAIRYKARCLAGQQESQLTATHNGPFQGQQTLQPASHLTATQPPLFRASKSTASRLTNESFAWLPDRL